MQRVSISVSLGGFFIIWGGVHFGLLGSVAMAVEPYEVAWSRQFGTSEDDRPGDVAIDSFGNAFISGWTEGSLDGTNAGDRDVFLTKYDVAGSLGAVNAGGHDAFLAKYGPTGALLWIEQLGSTEDDYSGSVALDESGNVFITGSTDGSLGGANAGGRDAFLAKYDATGGLLWAEQLGTDRGDGWLSVALDGSGNAFVSGFTSGDLAGVSAGNYDAILAKYDPDGTLLWVEQLGTWQTDDSLSTAVDGSGNVFISGRTSDNLGGAHAGGSDAFLAKYDPDGNMLWISQLGTATRDGSSSVAVDGSGNAFISGYTAGALGDTFWASHDAFLAKYDAAGNLRWVEQLGTDAWDVSMSMAIDKSNNVLMSGYTEGSFGGNNVGYDDTFLVKFVVPEPCAMSLLILGGLAVRRRRRA